jgi:hypothetical protein
MNTNTLTATREGMIRAGRTNHMSNVLLRANVGLKRRPFNPNSAVDRMQYARFMTEGKWVDGQSFNCEAPYPSVPATVERKLLAHFLKPELVKVANRIETVVDIRKAA